MGSRLLKPDAGLGWLRGDALELDRKIKQGDGLAWPGDPDMELRQGVITALRRAQHPKTGKWLNAGDIVARRWEVWRRCEDGVDRMIHHWREEEFDRILFDLAPLRLDAPGHVDSIAKADAANAVVQAKVDTQIEETLMDAKEYATKLHLDTTGPRTVFRGMPGLRDEPKAD